MAIALHPIPVRFLVRPCGNGDHVGGINGDTSIICSVCVLNQASMKSLGLVGCAMD